MKRISTKRILVILLCFILLYGGMYAVMLFVRDVTGENAQTEPFGDLGERFSAKTMLTYNGRSYAYREEQLVNVLLIGLDQDALSVAEGNGRRGAQADFMLLLSIDQSAKRITPIQIDRDTMARIPIYGVFGDAAGTRIAQICLAQAFGTTVSANCRNTAQAVSWLLAGIPIDYYLALDMAGISALNDALGGVTVTLEEDFTAQDLAMRAGTTLTLQGKQAEIFVRGRMSVSDGTNQARMQRQRVYLNAAMQRIFEKVSADLNFAGELYDALSEHIYTDMERGWLINEAYVYSKYDRGDIRTLAGEHAVGADGFIEFYPDEDARMALALQLFYKGRNGT